MLREVVEEVFAEMETEEATTPNPSEEVLQSIADDFTADEKKRLMSFYNDTAIQKLFRKLEYILAFEALNGRTPEDVAGSRGGKNMLTILKNILTQQFQKEKVHPVSGDKS